jgi:hypothetical protein
VVAAAATTMPGDGSAVPLAATGSPAQIPYLAPPMAAAPGTGEAPGGVVDEEARAALNQVIRSLRNIAEMVRGPQSRTILLDGYLVDTFDALRKAYDVDDLLNALKPVRKRESKRKA